ncbi:hypothetical protein CQA53_07815 [Helicobacter didelphidarum]|uniref:Methylenetetrahydrofolate reductase (NAD(P)H) n=1 Tax=Helicobacter didelphidarum TaxID=2040648 RepID=A0A3D8IGH6_9HELI|nr:hypothetical protein [Helicobacter didelphidarum]RDU64223.1 hypothetical protein CQA53_07815 [Helicobacter didelphidarum]
MIFEYLPINPNQDKKNLQEIINFLPVSKILIPSNPVSKVYPSPFVAVAYLQSLQCFSQYDFIPTIKTSIHTLESLESAFLSLQYLDIKNVAIISGDLGQYSSGVDTIQALKILRHLQRKNKYCYKPNIFCALESSISLQSLESFQSKILYGVHNFITQPFYEITSPISHKYSMASSQNVKELLSIVDQRNGNLQLPYNDFLDFYKHQINILEKNIQKDSTNQIASIIGQDLKDEELLYLAHNQLSAKSIRFYCGFFPLASYTQAYNIQQKNLGILLPSQYIKKLKDNPFEANFEVFYNLKEYDISIGYINFSDIQNFLEFLQTKNK